jgi:IS30 family transposase
MGCYSHLSDDEREQIGLAEALGHSIGAIAQAIGRPKSTVWRELCRNRLPSGRYSPLHAAGAYQLRRRREARIAWQRRANPVCLALLHLAPESRARQQILDEIGRMIRPPQLQEPGIIVVEQESDSIVWAHRWW